MRRILMIAAVAAIALVLGGWLLWGGTPENADAATRAEAPRRPPSVTVARVERREIAEEVHVSGTLVAREEVMVAPEIDGLAVTEILVEEGDRVEKGQVLARLSRVGVEAEHAQAAAAIAQVRAQIAEAQATVVQTRLALERGESLRKSGTVSAEIYDQRLSGSQVAEARLNAANENLKAAEAQKDQIAVRLARTEIKAPTAGIISRRSVRLGSISAVAVDPAFRIIEDGAIELQAEAIDSTLARFQIGQTVRIIPAGATEPLIGKIRLISPEVDAMTRLGRVRVALPEGAKATVGAFASGVVEIGRHVALTVPISAVSFVSGKNTVQIVADGKVATREITIGLRAPTRLEIRSGLSEGETVAARAGSFLRDGDAVTPVETPVAEGATL